MYMNWNTAGFILFYCFEDCCCTRIQALKEQCYAVYCATKKFNSFNLQHLYATAWAFLSIGRMCKDSCIPPPSCLSSSSPQVPYILSVIATAGGLGQIEAQKNVNEVAHNLAIDLQSRHWGKNASLSDISRQPLNHQPTWIHTAGIHEEMLR